MNDEAKPEQTKPTEQTEGTQQPESQAEPAQPEPIEEVQKPKMSKLAVLSIVCLVASLAIFVLYLKSSEAAFPITVERLLMPAAAVVLALALVTGVIGLVMIKTSGGALSGRRFALLGIIVPIVVGVAYLRTSPATCSECVPVSPAMQCRSNISQLAEMINKYRRDNDGQFPKAERWCDILLEQAKDESLFTCPLAEGGRCSYSLNKFVSEAGDDLTEDMVVLFESMPSWNQVGGPELFIAPHESRGGNTGSVTFANGNSRFVSEDDLDTLNWKGDKDTKDTENEENEEEEDE